MTPDDVDRQEELDTPEDSKRPAKEGKSFRLSKEAIRQLKWLIEQTGRSESMVVELALDYYYHQIQANLMSEK